MLSKLRASTLIVAFSVAATAASARAEKVEGELSLAAEYPGVEFSCGVLVLESQEDFEATVALLQKEDNDSAAADVDQAALDAFEDRFNFFSLRRYLEAMEEEEGELKPDVDHVYDDYLATIVNPEYKLVIGRSGYVLTADVTYEIVGIDACSLDAVRDVETTKGLEVIRHINNPSSDRRNLQVTPCDGWRGCTAYTEYNNGNRRFKGRIWIQNYPFYATAGTRTKHYRRKNNGNWKKKEKADEIWCSAAIVVTDNTCTSTSTGSFGDTKFNKKTVQESRSFWNQITKANAMVGLHGARDAGAECERFLDLFDCDDSTLSCAGVPPAPTPAPTPGPSCMAGSTGVWSAEDDATVMAVENLSVGETIQGLDKDKKPTTCTVEAKGSFGRGPVYGNYTADHYVLKNAADDSPVVSEHGAVGEEAFVDKYALLTSCPVGLDESGVGFTALDSDFFGTDAGAVSWSDYVLIHESILKLVKASGTFWFSPLTYSSMDVVGEYTPALYATMLDCNKDATTCEKFEAAAESLIKNALTDEAKEMANAAFPYLGETGAEGSVSAVISSRK